MMRRADAKAERESKQNHLIASYVNLRDTSDGHETSRIKNKRAVH